MKRIIRRSVVLLMLLVILVNTFGVLPDVEAAAAVPTITYQAHVKDTGWMGTVKNGAVAGTTGQARRLEAIKINLKKGKSSAISYRAHVQDTGWQGWKSSGAVAGTTGKGKRLEAIQIKLTGAYAKSYDVYYRVHVANAGWLGWAKNGATAGSTGSAIRVEAIQIKLVKKGTKVGGSTLADITKKPLTAQAHVQDKGWMSAVSEGSTTGTTGQGKRLEALKINLKDYNGGSGIKYSAHVAQIGWQEWKTSGQMAGTTGKALAIEAMKLMLTGTIAKYYDIYYRMHVANYGWLGWAKNGEVAGTTGGGIRAEAIEIRLVAKSVSFDTGSAAYINGANITTGIHLNHHMSGSLSQNSYNLYGYDTDLQCWKNWGCCAMAYATGLSIVNGRSYNPESFWRNQGCDFSGGGVNGSTDFNARIIYDKLVQGKPTLVHYEYGKYTTSQHWVLVIGVRGGVNKDAIQFSDFVIIDPWDGVEKNLTSAGSFGSRFYIGMRTFQ